MQGNEVKYQTFSVQADLRQLVKFIWTMEAKPNAGDYFVFRTFASISPTLLFVVKGHVEPINRQIVGNLLLIGQSNQWFRFKTSNDFKVFGITFSPVAFPLLFKLSADSLTNRVLDRSFISGTELLLKFCQNVLDNKYKPNNVNDLLSELAFSIDNKDENIISLITKNSTGEIDAADISHQNVFMSQRNFERKFKYYSGFSPKAFANLIRVKKSFDTVSFDELSLSDTTFQHSYFDQAHFSNEFKKHTGFQPKTFAKNIKDDNPIWSNFVDFFQFLSICPPVLCRIKI
jgi:AraC-like DNA-binding protein